MPPLSPKTLRHVHTLFAEPDRAQAIRLLTDECGNNIPFCEKSTSEQLERIRFAALKLSNGSLDQLRSAIDLARIDWRDLLMAAGFGNNIHAHQSWQPTPR